MAKLDELRERLGMRVREVWVAWAKEHANPKPTWLVPWEELSESDKEVDRRIGAAIWGDCIADHTELLADSFVALNLHRQSLAIKPSLSPEEAADFERLQSQVFSKLEVMHPSPTRFTNELNDLKKSLNKPQEVPHDE